MTEQIPPGALLILGALLLPLLRGRLRLAWSVALPLVSVAHLLSLPHGELLQLVIFDYTLSLTRVDKLSLVFGYIFHLALFLMMVYSLHERDALQQVSGLIYAGAAIGAVFAGDLITLFVYWELTAISSVFLIWARRNERSYKAGMRYLIIQVGSGVLLLAGALIHVQQTGSLQFGHIGLESPGGTLIFLAFGIKCAFPLLNNWLHDAYPEATVVGAVILSAFTTKLAVYALARGFAGTEMLIWIGAIMTTVPIFYAVIENDLRRVLAYSLNNQLGFMVVGIGVGTELALNGTISHAFCHILYKALLFMSMGAVLYRTGTIKASELGGIYKSMPYTTVFCCVGSASISAFPLFSGFISKGLILAAVLEEHHTVIWLVLLFASAGVMHHAGIKIPFYGFFSRDSGIRCKEAPKNMLLAMGLTALLCIVLGVLPGPLYALLPFGVDFDPYTAAHVITQLQLLFFAGLAFSVLKRIDFEPHEIPSVNLDTDVLYRKAIPAVVSVAMRTGGRTVDALGTLLRKGTGLLIDDFRRDFGPHGVFARTRTTGATVLWVAVILCVILLLYYS